MRKSLLLLLALCISSATFAQKQAYVIYNKKGKKVSYEKMIKKLSKKDIILFGELHNNPIAHWLELEVATDLAASRDLILGAEMIEADNQDALNLYLQDSIDYIALDTLARLWGNYPTDYAPLVDIAKENNIPFVASNVPRRYARMVHRNGFESLDTLSDLDKSWIAPLPIPFDADLPTYKNILEMMGEHATPQLVMAQALKDATMAHFILANFVEDHIFLHFNGAYHSDDYEGILWYIQQQNKDLEFITISTVTQENVNKLEKENKQKADFIICVDSDMTTTY